MIPTFEPVGIASADAGVNVCSSKWREVGEMFGSEPWAHLQLWIVMVPALPVSCDKMR